LKKKKKKKKKKAVMKPSSQLHSLPLFRRFGPPIDTVADLAASLVPWAATHPAWIFSLREGRDPLTLRIISQFRVMKSEELRKRSFMGDVAFSIERLPAGKVIAGWCVHVCIHCEIWGFHGGEDDGVLILGFGAV
jgi:hypothetical protein